MEDLEAQISQAADELARESRNGTVTDGEPATSRASEPPLPQPDAASQNALRRARSEPGQRMPMGLRPVEPQPRRAGQPAGSPPPMMTGRKTSAPSSARSTGAHPTASIGQSRCFRSPGSPAALCSAHLLFGPTSGRSAPRGCCSPGPIRSCLAVGIIMPVILFWAFARHDAPRPGNAPRRPVHDGTRVPPRRARTLAQDRVMMVGQAVRREVAAMGEGIERTLGARRRARNPCPHRSQRARTRLFAE